MNYHDLEIVQSRFALGKFAEMRFVIFELHVSRLLQGVSHENHENGC